MMNHPLKYKFCGRDRATLGGGSVNLPDYAYERYLDVSQGRFLSIDPGGWDKHRPQTWNRYVYAENNPILKVDPDGRDVEIAASSNVNAVKSYLTELMRRPSGRALVTAIVNDQGFKLRIGTGTLTPPALIQQSLQQKTRYLDVAQGRFLSVDPQPAAPERPQTWNRYSYVMNNPLLYTDPTGEIYELYGFVNDADEQKLFQDLRKLCTSLSNAVENTS
jgi:RHS repeat-associated protein